MSARILITGGAGFIGSHLGDRLLEAGYTVRVLDALVPQVHGTGRRPDYLSREIELIVGDIRNREVLEAALQGIEMVVHLAAKVGVGQSMYEIADYTSVNSLGTATLLELLAERPVRRLVVASSMSIYGEGLYRDARGRLVEGAERPVEQLRARDWSVRAEDGSELSPVPTPEQKRPVLPSVYAISKYQQERLCMSFGRSYGVPTVGLRFFNAYGPRQALSNPYTGVLAIFASRYLNGRAPLVHEDGLQRRDFVSVHDVSRACQLALESPGADGCVFNIGSGTHRSVLGVAAALGRLMGGQREPEVTGTYRVGDIRNCFADITLAKNRLGYQPSITLEQGLPELVQWLEGQSAVDRVGQAAKELAMRGLTL